MSCEGFLFRGPFKNSEADFLYSLYFPRVKGFNSIPYYRDKVFDPDPDRSYTKAKLDKLKRSNDTVANTLEQTGPGNHSLLIASHRTSLRYFQKTFLFYLHLCLWTPLNKLGILECQCRCCHKL